MTSLKRLPVFREDGTIEIHLTRGYVVIIDAVDVGQAQFNWSANVTPEGNVYGQRTVVGKTVQLHRAILGLGEGRDVQADHIDGNTLDCRRGNLRPVSGTVNRRNRIRTRANTSGYVGVTWKAKDRRWFAQIDRKHLGSFDTAEQANAARLAAERELWGIEPRRADAHK